MRLLALGGHPKPANEVTTDPEAENPVAAESSAPPPSPPSGSSCEPYRETARQALERGRNAMAIWQDLGADQGFAGSYESVKRFVRKLRGVRSPEAVGIIQTGAGEEAQVDYGTRRMDRVGLSTRYGPPLRLVNCSDHRRACGGCGKAEGFSKL